MILRGETERMWMELDVVFFEILSRHLLGGTWGNNADWQTVNAVTRSVGPVECTAAAKRHLRCSVPVFFMWDITVC
jgi:hypothetical protein